MGAVLCCWKARQDVIALQEMSFDLGDCTKWEFMFPQTEQPQLLVPEQEGADELGMEDEVRS